MEYSLEALQLISHWNKFLSSRNLDIHIHPSPNAVQFLLPLAQAALAAGLIEEEKDPRAIQDRIVSLIALMLEFRQYLDKNGINLSTLTPCTCFDLTDEDVSHLLMGE